MKQGGRKSPRRDLFPSLLLCSQDHQGNDQTQKGGLGVLFHIPEPRCWARFGLGAAARSPACEQRRASCAGWPGPGETRPRCEERGSVPVEHRHGSAGGKRRNGRGRPEPGLPPTPLLVAFYTHESPRRPAAPLKPAQDPHHVSAPSQAPDPGHQATGARTTAPPGGHRGICSASYLAGAGAPEGTGRAGDTPRLYGAH